MGIVYPQNNWVLPTNIGVTPAKNVIWFSQQNLRVWHLTKKKAKSCGEKECETKRFRNVNNKMVVVTTKRRGDKIMSSHQKRFSSQGSHQLHQFWSHRGNRRNPVPDTLNGPRCGSFCLNQNLWFRLILAIRERFLSGSPCSMDLNLVKDGNGK